MDIETLLCDEIRSELELLKDLEVGTPERKTSVDEVCKLVDRAIELEKINVDTDEKAKNREIEHDLKLKQFETDTDLKLKQLEEQIKVREVDTNLRLRQMEEEQKSRFINNCIVVAGIIVPTVVTIWGTLKSFEFEKDGTITTIMGRGFINKLLLKK